MKNSAPYENTNFVPASELAEKEIIAAILMDPKENRYVLETLKSDMFFFPETKMIYKAMEELEISNKVITVPNTIEQLKYSGKTGEINIEEYLIELSQLLPYRQSVEPNARIIAEKALERDLLKYLETTRYNLASGKEELGEVLTAVKDKMDQIGSSRHLSSLDPVSNYTDKIIEDMINRGNNQNGLIGLDTGFEELNRLTYGLKKDELVVLAARPGIGKTTFALNVVLNTCKSEVTKNKSVALFSLEMGIDQLVSRFLSIISAVPLEKISKGQLEPEELAKIKYAKEILDRYDIRLEENPNTYLDEIIDKCYDLKRNGNLDLIVIDYLQLVQIKQGQGRNVSNRNEEIGRISRSLKKLAINLRVPILALSQLNRKAEGDSKDSENPEPQLHHLRESGSIEQDADTVLFLHDPVKREGNFSNEGRKIKMVVAKNRHGNIGVFELRFKGKISTFITEAGRLEKREE